MKEINLQSDDWHADETVVFINGIKYYLWLVIDSETLFIVSFHLSIYRDESSTFSLINEARKYGSPSNLITDRLPVYTEAIATLLPSANHIPVKPMSSDTNNNLIESWYKAKKEFNSFEKVNNLIYLLIFHYNFIISHSSLNKHTPAGVAGFTSDSFNKNSWFTAQQHNKN